MNGTREQYTVGLDLGGTKLAAALVNGRGQIIEYEKISILELKADPRLGPRLITRRMAEITNDFRKRRPRAFQKRLFRGVGLASAGPMNIVKGTLNSPANFQAWKNVPLKALLEAELRKFDLLPERGAASKVFFQNDAIAAARAEAWIGAAQGLKSYAVITIGTGIGCGVIFQDRPVQTHGMGSEFGHSLANFDAVQTAQDLRSNTIEGLASGTGILRQARALGFTGHNIEELAEAPRFHAPFSIAAKALATLCYNLSMGFNVEKILFSGGLIKVRHLYFTELKAHYKMLINELNPAFRCPLVVAKAKNNAGVIGSAWLPYSKSSSSDF